MLDTSASPVVDTFGFLIMSKSGSAACGATAPSKERRNKTPAANSSPPRACSRVFPRFPGFFFLVSTECAIKWRSMRREKDARHLRGRLGPPCRVAGRTFVELTRPQKVKTPLWPSRNSNATPTTRLRDKQGPAATSAHPVTLVCDSVNQAGSH